MDTHPQLFGRGTRAALSLIALIENVLNASYLGYVAVVYVPIHIGCRQCSFTRAHSEMFWKGERETHGVNHSS